MITTRFNFETNSSSMHSLSYRRDEGLYDNEDISRSESMHDMVMTDAIIVMKEGHGVNMDSGHFWIWNNSVRFSSYELSFRNSPMEILSSFKDKLRYAIATSLGFRYKGWENRYQEIVDIFHSRFENVELNVCRGDIKEAHFSPTNSYLLYPFLKKYNISMEEFLNNNRYVVVVNYAEFMKMKSLNMVDETYIDSLFMVDEVEHKKMEIVDGVWSLTESDITFGRSPYRVLGTPEGKARYALASYRSENIQEITEILQEIYPDLKEIRLPRSWYNKEELECGYCEDCVIPHNVDLKEFILNKKYVVISDGDEYCVWSEFKQTPLFNRDAYPNEEIDDDDYYEDTEVGGD